MINEHIAALLKAQWDLLWPLNPEERRKRIEETRLDYVAEEVLNLVRHEMELRDAPRSAA